MADTDRKQICQSCTHLQHVHKSFDNLVGDCTMPRIQYILLGIYIDDLLFDARDTVRGETTGILEVSFVRSG